jgi:trk system potassium uptake protein TrkH
MIIGAAPGGTGGGLKVTALATVWDGTRDVLRRKNPGRPFGIALVWVGIYGVLLIAALLALLITAPQISPDEIFFLATSALGNVGLSHDPVALADSALSVLSMTMLMGRIVPILILWWMVLTTPEAEVALG